MNVSFIRTKIYLLDIMLFLLAIWATICIAFGAWESAALALLAASPGIFIVVAGRKRWGTWRWWETVEGGK